ncbi:MAG: hypothetical protein AAB300_00720 [Nitrospirota bacterium]
MAIRQKISVLVSLLLLIPIISIQKRIDLTRGDFHAIHALSDLPSGPLLRIAALEYKSVMADLLWLRAVQLLDEASGPRYDRFYEITDRVTDLDPLFSPPYLTGGIALSFLAKKVSLSNAILEKGTKNDLPRWEIPFYLGFNYLYHLNDPVMAARYMEQASKLPGSPEYLPLLVARLYRQGDNHQTAVLFLKGVYLTTHDEKIKEKIAERIIEIEKEMAGHVPQ